MGKMFGELITLRRIVFFKLSPYEQNPMAGAIKDGIPNWIRRLSEETPFVGPPFILGYLLYDWGEKEHARLQRKNPADYVNDV